MKYCMQCDSGKVDAGRTCQWCQLASCEHCMPPGQKTCEHCRNYNMDLKALTAAGQGCEDLL